MSHILDRGTTKYLLTKMIAGNPSAKKAATRMADRLAALFILCLEERLLNLGDKKLTVDDVVGALKKDKEFADYVDVFKKGAEEDVDETEEEIPTKKKNDTSRKSKKK